MNAERLLLLQVDLSIDDMDVNILRKCFQLHLEDVIIYLLENCGCRTTLQIAVRSVLRQRFPRSRKCRVDSFILS